MTTSTSKPTYIGLDIETCIYGCTPAEIYLVTNDLGLALLALDVDTGRLAGDDLVSADLHGVLGPGLDHNAT